MERVPGLEVMSSMDLDGFQVKFLEKTRVELTSVPGGQNAMAHLKKRKLEAESVSPNPKQPQQPQQQQQQQHYQQQQPLINKKAVQAIIPQEMETADAAAKRRRKSVRDDETRKSLDANDSNKNIPLPQKKRAFAAGNSGSPARKSSKHSEEPEDDETLIRETEAALKSLSGSWPGPRGSLYQRGNSDEDKYESNFENLFEEKKDNPKLSPSSMSTSSTTSNDAGCSLKDVITFRGQQDRSSRSQLQLKQQDATKQQQHASKVKKDLDSLLKSESECGMIQNQVNNVTVTEAGKIRAVPVRSLSNKDRNDRSMIGTHVDAQGRQTDKYSRYDPPDFNELVDDSSNELEIDMSDPSAEKDDADRDKMNDRDRDRTCRNGQSPQNPSRHQQHQHHQQLYANYHRQFTENGMKVSPTASTASSSSPPSNSPFSATSAFRPPNTDHAKATGRGTPSVASTTIPPIGPYPASATFVGYPTAGPGPAMPTPQPVTGISPATEDKHSASVSLLQLKSSKEEVHHVTRHEVPPNTVTGNKSPTGGLPAVTSPDSSKQYTILQPAGIGSRAASAIQDIARDGVVSVTAVSSCSTTNGSTTNGISGNSNGGTCGSNVASKTTNSNGSGNASGTANPVSNGNGNNVTNSIAITAVSTTTTTSSPSTGADASSGTGTVQQDSVMKMPERPVTFDGNRPGMSMSPSSLSRGWTEMNWNASNDTRELVKLFQDGSTSRGIFPRLDKVSMKEDLPKFQAKSAQLVLNLYRYFRAAFTPIRGMAINDFRSQFLSRPGHRDTWSNLAVAVVKKNYSAKVVIINIALEAKGPSRRSHPKRLVLLGCIERTGNL
ncbi:hypothetical protein WN48_06978 [Eufriesea mexicana]|uniref:Uncharacterized protein n=1 Tax=Eufriesea mexicana TaxID=516756 RepID=A0A310SW75_9HYME|nr:hypothetical protein WN48_06978 [Eufriesea mexicana]